MRTAIRRRAVTCVLLPGILLWPIIAGAADGLADPAALRERIDEAYYARDLQGIEAAREALLVAGRAPAEAHIAAYYAAYARFRQSLVAAGDKKGARRYLDGCIADLETLIERRPEDARAHAMLASCYGTSAQFYILRAPARGLQAGRHLEEALKLAPDDPWVILQDAIADYSLYLQTLYNQYIEQLPYDVRIVLLGFSQGTATICRWALRNHPHFHDLILWAGLPPEDLDYAGHRSYLTDKNLYLLYGTSDPFLTPDRLATVQEIEDKNGLDFEEQTFDGGHEIPSETLRQLMLNLR